MSDTPLLDKFNKGEIIFCDYTKIRSLEQMEKEANEFLKNSRVALLDLDSIAYACFHPNKELDFLGEPKRTEDGKRFIYQDKTPLEVIESTDKLITDILESCNCTHYIAIIKGSNTTGYKLKINPEYKADRSSEEPKYWKFTKEYLKLKWGAIEANNIETDDYIRICNLRLPNSFIVAIDGDLLGLSGKHYNWKKKEWIETSENQQIENFWKQMITGNHNNLKGLPGKGEKFAEKIFDQEIKSPNYDHSIIVYKEYIAQFGVEEGIEQYYKHYKCTKTLTDYPGFELPNCIEYKKESKETSDEIKF